MYCVIQCRRAPQYIALCLQFPSWKTQSRFHVVTSQSMSRSCSLHFAVTLHRMLHDGLRSRVHMVRPGDDGAGRLRAVSTESQAVPRQVHGSARTRHDRRHLHMSQPRTQRNLCLHYARTVHVVLSAVTCRRWRLRHCATPGNVGIWQLHCKHLDNELSGALTAALHV